MNIKDKTTFSNTSENEWKIPWSVFAGMVGRALVLPNWKVSICGDGKRPLDFLQRG